MDRKLEEFVIDGSFDRLFAIFTQIAGFLIIIFIFSYALYKIVKIYARDDVGETVAPFLGCLASQLVVVAVVAVASALSAPDVVQWSLLLITSAVATWLTVKFFVRTTFQKTVAITLTWFVLMAILVWICNSPLIYVT